METIERYSQNQRIIEEFSDRCLALLESDYTRLLALSTARNVSTGRYFHPDFGRTYSEPAVHQALIYCHEEIFGRVLEMPLESQEWELRRCLASIGGCPGEIAARWLQLEYYRTFVPFGTPSYLRDLFNANMRVMLQSIVLDHAEVASAA
ncbi:MAG TPA: hypothetical protein VMJ93_08985 [Verrucomicrobiae bacterium]|nr:hypothetical protein [Verrucomicrobiae bacterium]